MENEIRGIEIERSKRKIMDNFFADTRRDINFNNDGSLSHMNFEYRDPNGSEFCVCFDYVDKSMSPRSTKAWKLNHVNKWADPVLGEAGDHPWAVDVNQAEKEIKKNGIVINDLFRYVLILERDNLLKSSLSNVFERTKPKRHSGRWLN